MADDDDRTAGLSSKTQAPASGTTADSGAPKARQRRRAVRGAGAPGGANAVPPQGAGASSTAPEPETGKTEAGKTEAGKEAATAEAPETSTAPAEATKSESAAAGWTSFEKESTPSAVGEGSGARPSSEQSADESPTKSRSSKSLALVGVAGVLLVALIAAAVFLAVARYQTQSDNERRQDYVDAAKQAVLNLTTIHPESAQDDVARIIDGSTGEFREDFEGRRDPFVSVIQDSQVKTDGQIVEAAMENETDGPTTVLVAAKTTVSSVDEPEPADRDFRMRVTVVDEDGQLKASKLEFVP